MIWHYVSYLMNVWQCLVKTWFVCGKKKILAAFYAVKVSVNEVIWTHLKKEAVWLNLKKIMCVSLVYWRHILIKHGNLLVRVQTICNALLHRKVKIIKSELSPKSFNWTVNTKTVLKIELIDLTFAFPPILPLTSVTVIFFFNLSNCKGILMPFFQRTVLSRKAHSECSLCMCRFCMALRRQRTTCDSLIKVSTSVLKRYNFCLYSFKYRLLFDPWWLRQYLVKIILQWRCLFKDHEDLIFTCILRCTSWNFRTSYKDGGYRMTENFDLIFDYSSIEVKY